MSTQRLHETYKAKGQLRRVGLLFETLVPVKGVEPSTFALQVRFCCPGGHPKLLKNKNFLYLVFLHFTSFSWPIWPKFGPNLKVVSSAG